MKKIAVVMLAVCCVLFGSVFLCACKSTKTFKISIDVPESVSLKLEDGQIPLEAKSNGSFEVSAKAEVVVYIYLASAEVDASNLKVVVNNKVYEKDVDLIVYDSLHEDFEYGRFALAMRTIKNDVSITITL